MTATATITAEDRTFFLEEGYLLIEELLTTGELERLNEIYSQAFDPDFDHPDLRRHNLGGTLDGRQVLPQILGPHRVWPELVEGPLYDRLLATARDLLGPEADFRGCHMILKPAGYGSPTPWHQDQAYHDPGFRYTNVNFWMPLQDATIECGCMQFVPGTHRGTVVPHEVISTPGGHALSALGQEYWHANGVAVPCPKGGATLHHSYTMHYAAANKTAVDRRALILVFALPPVPLDRPLQFNWRKID